MSKYFHRDIMNYKIKGRRVFLNKIEVSSLVIVILLFSKGFSEITLLKDHWYTYLIGILFINLGMILSKKGSRLKKLVIMSYLVAGGVILLTVVLRDKGAKYNYTYSPDYQHRLVLKQINSNKIKGGSTLEVHEQFGIFKEKKGSMYIRRKQSPLTLDLIKPNGNVFEPKKEFDITGIHFLWETNNILKVNCRFDNPYIPEGEAEPEILVILSEK